MDGESSAVRIQNGIPQDVLEEAAALYLEGRLKHITGVSFRDETPQSLVDRLDAEYAYSALSADGGLLGIAAVADTDGGFLKLAHGNARRGGFGRLARFGDLFSRDGSASFVMRPTRRTNLLLDAVCVSPAGLQAGVGEALLDCVIADARRRGAKRLQTYVEEPNPHVTEVYQQHGFRPARRSALVRGSPNYALRQRTLMLLDLS